MVYNSPPIFTCQTVWTSHGKSLQYGSERELARLNKVLKALAPVVQTLDSAIHRIDHYPANSVIDVLNTYPLDRSAARVLTSYMTTGIRSFLSLWWKRGYTTKLPSKTDHAPCSQRTSKNISRKRVLIQLEQLELLTLFTWCCQWFLG